MDLLSVPIVSPTKTLNMWWLVSFVMDINLCTSCSSLLIILWKKIKKSIPFKCLCMETMSCISQYYY